MRAADVLSHLLEAPRGHGQHTFGCEQSKIKMHGLSRSKPSNAWKAESKSFDTNIALDNWLSEVMPARTESGEPSAKDFSTNDAKKGT
ncbi:MAG: hypothetical protein KKF20_03745 [Bacteroidetes bacterium]|nr:hypothetical protein [Bacteroidota bacterium]MBU1422763.1 hypothetical protein [Bacteroidota bacterium]MBU2471502.1 hypothetical protein [Bacteroidota bacterium]